MDVHDAVDQQGAPARSRRAQGEGERQLGAHPAGPRDARAELGGREPLDHVAQVGHLLGPHGRAVRLDQLADLALARDERPAEVQALEQLMHERPSQQGAEGRVGERVVREGRVDRRQAQRALEVEAIGAAPVALERGVAEAADGQRARGGQRGESELRLSRAAGRLLGGLYGDAIGSGQQLVDVCGAQLGAARLPGASKPPQQPAHRLPHVLRLRKRLEVRRSAEHEVLHRTGDRDVEDALLLLLAADLLALP